MLTEDARFQVGREGTVVSLGCFGESLAPHAFPITLEFLRSFAPRSNVVQIATRWILDGGSLDAFMDVSQKLSLHLFHSFSTITRRGVLEAATPSTGRRRAFMTECSRRGIASVLYIKPFLPGVTIESGAQFIDVAVESGIGLVVVGPLYLDDTIRARLDDRMVLGREYFGIRDHPVGSRPSAFGGEHPELLTLTAQCESAGLRVFRHGSEVSRHLLAGGAAR
jgi:DNA repair photolyase